MKVKIPVPRCCDCTDDDDDPGPDPFVSCDPNHPLLGLVPQTTGIINLNPGNLEIGPANQGMLLVDDSNPGGGCDGSLDWQIPWYSFHVDSDVCQYGINIAHAFGNEPVIQSFPDDACDCEPTAVNSGAPCPSSGYRFTRGSSGVFSITGSTLRWGHRGRKHSLDGGSCYVIPPGIDDYTAYLFYWMKQFPVWGTNRGSQGFGDYGWCSGINPNPDWGGPGHCYFTSAERSISVSGGPFVIGAVYTTRSAHADHTHLDVSIEFSYPGQENPNGSTSMNAQCGLSADATLQSFNNSVFGSVNHHAFLDADPNGQPTPTPPPWVRINNYSYGADSGGNGNFEDFEGAIGDGMSLHMELDFDHPERYQTGGRYYVNGYKILDTTFDPIIPGGLRLHPDCVFPISWGMTFGHGVSTAAGYWTNSVPLVSFFQPGSLPQLDRWFYAPGSFDPAFLVPNLEMEVRNFRAVSF